MTRLTAVPSLMVLILSFLFIQTAQAQMQQQIETDRVFGDYRVTFSAFNSTFVPPEVAANHGITRAATRGLVNISVMEKDAGVGQPAVVEGTVTDMLSRPHTLDFFEVRDGDAVYYLAPFDFIHREPMTFRIRVRIDEDSPVMPVEFRRTFYRD